MTDRYVDDKQGMGQWCLDAGDACTGMSIERQAQTVAEQGLVQARVTFGERDRWGIELQSNVEVFEPGSA